MNKKKKVLHTMTWLAKGGGVDNNVFLTVNGLKDEFEFHLVTGSEIHHNPFTSVDGLKHFVCNDLVRPIRPWKDLQAFFYFVRLIRREKYDIVHTHETKASLLSRLAAKVAGCRYIIYGLHGVTFNDPMSKMKRLFYILLERATTGVSSCIVGVSNDVIEHYHRNRIGRKIPYKVIYSGIDTGRFTEALNNYALHRAALRKELSISDDEIVLINTGRFSNAKAQRYTIDCFARIKNKHPRVKLLLVGEGELMIECKAQVQKLSLEKDVIFYGFSAEPARLLTVADIHVLTSLREGLPRVAVEASLMKVPTVAFSVEGIREVVDDNINGYVVPTGDVTLLAEKISGLIQQPELRLIFGEKAFDKVHTQWDSKTMIRELRELYNHPLTKLPQ